MVATSNSGAGLAVSLPAVSWHPEIAVWMRPGGPSWAPGSTIEGGPLPGPSPMEIVARSARKRPREARCGPAVMVLARPRSSLNNPFAGFPAGTHSRSSS